MSMLIIVGLFVGLGFVLAIGFFSMTHELYLGTYYPPLLSPDDGDEGEFEDATVAAALSSNQRGEDVFEVCGLTDDFPQTGFSSQPAEKIALPERSWSKGYWIHRVAS
jgi:hypothetical protein